jgi:hypothetical protein
MSNLREASVAPRVDDSICPKKKLHTKDPTEPEGYIEWHAWARKQGRTHKQKKCPGCGLFKIWVPREKRVRSNAGK